MALPDPFPGLNDLEQFARSVGISKAKATALYTRGELPKPDRIDDGGNPWWRGTTINAWCGLPGKMPGKNSDWLREAVKATEQAPVLFDGIIDHSRRYTSVTLHAIVWDTAHGHVVYLTPVYDEHGHGAVHPDFAAEAAASLIRPRFWGQALIVQPITGGLGSGMIIPTVHVNLHRLALRGRGDGAYRTPGSATERKAAGSGPTAEAEAVFEGMVEARHVADVIGAPLPLWIEATCTKSAVRRFHAYGATFTIPDTVTDWPPARDQIQAALAAGMPGRFPAAFATVAAAARDAFNEVTVLHSRQEDKGDGWYLVARPAIPEFPFALERAVTEARPSDDLDAIVLELTELRAIEANLPTDAPEGDAYETAVALLSQRIRKLDPNAAIDKIEAYGDIFSGPVIDQWRETMHPVPDLDTALKTRRVRRLLQGTWDRENVVEVLQGPGDRHVAVVKNEHGHVYFEAEWPYALPHGWNDQTIIAADPESTGAVFALTPTASGHMTVDPLPLEPQTGPSFGYGYSGGSPYTLYQALIRCAFGTPSAPFRLNDITGGRQAGTNSSALWHAIVKTKGPLRLPWPTVQQWAREDGLKAGYAEGGLS